MALHTRDQYEGSSTTIMVPFFGVGKKRRATLSKLINRLRTFSVGVAARLALVADLAACSGSENDLVLQ
jgi:hypothetical protein